MLNYKKPVKVSRRKTVIAENEQVTIAPADTKTQVIKAGNKTIGTVSNPAVANQLKTAIQKGEVNLAQDLKEEAPPDQEQWVKDNKEKFIKQYGKKGEAILYATAWQRHNDGVKESKRSELDKIFESVAFDEPDPVSHILSKFKFEVNQFCQGQQINPDLYDCLYDYYLDAGLMPYGVAKARDANPIEWVSSKLKEYLGQCGVSQQTAQPLDSQAEVQNEQPVPEYGDDVEQSVSPEPTEQEIDQMFESILGNRMINEGWTDDKKVIMTRLAPVLSKYKLKATVGLFNNNTIQLKITSGDIDFVTNTVNKSTHDKGYCARVLKTKNIQVSKDGFQTAFTGRAVEALAELFKAIKYGDYGSYFTIYIGGIDGSYKLTGPKEKWNTSAQEQLGLTNESKIKESKMPALTPQQRRDPKFIEKLVSQAMIKFFEAKGFSKVKDTILEKEIGPNYVTVEIEKSRGYETYTYQDEIFNAPPMVIKLEMDGKTLSEKSVEGVEPDSLQKLFTRTYEPLTSKIKESKMKVTQPKRKQVAESSIDRKSKLMEAVDPKSVYIVVKNVPRLKDIRCDIGITYDMRFDPESESFSALNLKLVDMETGQKYSQKQVMMDTLRKLMAIAQKDATDRAEKNDLFHDDFDEDGIPLPVVSGILKNSKPVTFDYVRVAKSLAESSIDRKARQLVDSWNMKLKQKLKESPEYKQGDSVTLGSGFLKGKKAKIVKIDGQWLEVNPDGEAKDFVIKVKKSDLVESTQKRKLREGVSISTSQSQGFGYDEIDGNTSINVCATGEDAVRLAEILRDAGYGQFKLDHIAVPQKAIAADYDDAGEVQQPEYDPMPEYDETQPEADYEADHVEGDDESQLLDRIKQFVSYGAESPVEEITEAEEMEDSEVVVYDGKLGIIVDTDTGADNEYEVMFADGTEVISGTDLEPATQAQINASKDIVKYVGDDAQFAGRYGVIIEEDGDEYHVAFSDGETWIVGTDLEAPALQESFANEYQMNEPAQTNYMTHGISGGLNSLRRSQATGNVTRISTMESKGKGRKMLKESKQAVGKPSDELASMANLVEAISVQQRIKFGG